VRKKDSDVQSRLRLLVLVDESNVGSSVRTAGRGLDWLKLRDFLAGPNTGRDLIEMVVYAGLPPAIPTWQDERDKKNKFVHWLRSNGFMVVTKDGAPAEEGHYKANVDVMMAIDALELSIEMRPDVVILVTGDADFTTARHPRGSRVSRRKSRQPIEIRRERSDRSGSALSDIRDQTGSGRAAAGVTSNAAGTAQAQASVSSHCYIATSARRLKLMGHSQGRDNAKKRARRRKKTERLALAKKKTKK